jgi:hypothetical protein
MPEESMIQRIAAVAEKLERLGYDSESACVDGVLEMVIARGKKGIFRKAHETDEIKKWMDDNYKWMHDNYNKGDRVYVFNEKYQATIRDVDEDGAWVVWDNDIIPDTKFAFKDLKKVNL